MSLLIRIRREILNTMREEAARTPAQECCGLLAGSNGIITHICPATNAHSQAATAYEVAPHELFRAMKEIRAKHLELMGIYHSHPHGENQPSRSDVERAFYPDTPYFILSPLPEAPQPVRAFLIRQGSVVDLKLEVV